MRITGCAAFVLLAACAGEQSSSSEELTREPGECSPVEVHVIGVSEVSDGGTGTVGTGTGGGSTVILERPGHHILVLSAKKTTQWNVEVKGDAKLDGIYAVGEEPQLVKANVATKIATESTMTGGAGANGYRYPDAATSALLKLTSIRVSRHATSFHGCFSASKWVIGADMAVSSDCAPGTYTKYDAVLDCDGDNTCGGGSLGPADGPLL